MTMIEQTKSGRLHKEDRPLLTVIVPIYREGAYITEILDSFSKALSDQADNTELIVVDDGSDDNTWQELNEYQSAFQAFLGIRLSRNFGKEAALCAGLEVARGEAVVTIDGDLQHPPELIPTMLQHWQIDGYDVVEAVKRSRGQEKFLNRAGADSFYSILNWLSGFDLKGASDFKLMDRRVVDALCEMGERNLFFRGMSNWVGFSRKQIEFDVADRFDGQSKWSRFSLIKLAATAISAFSALPLQLVTILGSLLFLFSLLLGVQTLLRWSSGSAIDGFTTVIILQLGIGSIIMISLGIVGTYVARIYTEVKGRPRFVIADRFTN